MNVQASKRNRQIDTDNWPPRVVNSSKVQLPHVGWMYREISESFADRLNIATRPLKDKRIRRKTDDAILTLVYPNRLLKAQERSRMSQPPSILEVAKKLGQLGIRTMNEPVVAKIVGIETFQGALALKMDYPGLSIELNQINRTVAEELDPRYRTIVTPGIAHVSIIRGMIMSTGQIAQIKSALPDSLELSPVKQNLGQEQDFDGLVF
jgi:hypothetical protein